jgi:beta-galactosidase
VFLNGEFIGTLDRREGINTIDIPESKAERPLLEILVEGMGRINFAQNLIDRKGITDRVTLNGMTLMNWKVYNLPMNDKFIYNLRSSNRTPGKRGIFFKGNFFLSAPGDTFLDLSNFQKGIIWVNGHNLGRYWNIGPQKRFYCPASFLRKGNNEMIVLDLLQTEPQIVVGFKTAE